MQISKYIFQILNIFRVWSVSLLGNFTASLISQTRYVIRVVAERFFSFFLI